MSGWAFGLSDSPEQSLCWVFNTSSVGLSEGDSSSVLFAAIVLHLDFLTSSTLFGLIL
jgi:hypothetical protein